MKPTRDRPTWFCSGTGPFAQRTAALPDRGAAVARYHRRYGERTA